MKARLVVPVAVPAATFLVVGAVVFLLFGTGLGRTLRGISTIVVRNTTLAPLAEVSITAADGRGATHERTVAELGVGECLQLRVRTPDLCLTEVSWTIAGKGSKHVGGGIACPGEVFMVEILPSGEVKTYYARE